MKIFTECPLAQQTVKSIVCVSLGSLIDDTPRYIIDLHLSIYKSTFIYLDDFIFIL